jgi:hypothetical protein
MFNAVLYGWTPEVFPAPVRGTGSGLASFWGRLFGIIAPLTAQSLLPAGGISTNPQAAQKVLYLAGGVTVLLFFLFWKVCSQQQTIHGIRLIDPKFCVWAVNQARRFLFTIRTFVRSMGYCKTYVF